MTMSTKRLSKLGGALGLELLLGQGQQIQQFWPGPTTCRTSIRNREVWWAKIGKNQRSRDTNEAGVERDITEGIGIAQEAERVGDIGRDMVRTVPVDEDTEVVAGKRWRQNIGLIVRTTPVEKDTEVAAEKGGIQDIGITVKLAKVDLEGMSGSGSGGEVQIGDRDAVVLLADVTKRDEGIGKAIIGESSDLPLEIVTIRHDEH